MLENTDDAIEVLAEYGVTAQTLASGEVLDLLDILSEAANGNVDTYLSDLLEWVADHYSYMERAVDEFGWEGVGENLEGAIRMGQCLYHDELLAEAIKELDEEAEELKA